MNPLFAGEMATIERPKKGLRWRVWTTRTV